MKKLLTLPNLLTALRIAGAVCMIFMPPLTQAFFIIYTLCGVSDVLDGTIARAWHSESDFGARLDSIADLLFYAVMLLRIFPVLWERLPFCLTSHPAQQADGLWGIYDTLFHRRQLRHRLLLCRLRHRISRLGGGATDTHSLPGVHPRSHVPV